MRTAAFLKSCAYAVLLAAFALGAGAVARADDLSDALAPISGRTDTTAAATTADDVLALNTAMFELYGNAGKVFQKNILSQHPVILGLFSGAGGRFILYRPGMPPLEAPSVPVVYQLLKSVGHSTMALAEVVGPYLDNADNQSWRGSMLAYRSRMQSALDGVAKTPMPPEWVENNVVSVLCLDRLVHWTSRRLGWWLQPTGPTRQQTTMVGAAMVVGIYLLTLLAFSQI